MNGVDLFDRPRRREADAMSFRRWPVGPRNTGPGKDALTGLPNGADRLSVGIGEWRNWRCPGMWRRVPAGSCGRSRPGDRHGLAKLKVKAPESTDADLHAQLQAEHGHRIAEGGAWWCLAKMQEAERTGDIERLTALNEAAERAANASIERLLKVPA